MDSLYIILFIIVIALLINNNNSLSKKIGELEFRILNLHEAVRKLNLPKPTSEEQKTTPPKEEIPVSKPVAEKAPDIPKSVPAPLVETEVVEYHKEVITDHKADTIKSKIEVSYIHQQPEEPQLSFFERYPDLEKFIGENLVNKIGIAILVLAIGFFVKYAIDNNWVGPAGRVGIGVLCGGILIGIAHRLRNGYKAFSSVLVGGGLAIFYFTITLAYHEFHLFNQTTSFIILIVITCFAVALSMLYDKQELAVIALVGGMSSPFMVSNGSANYNALFIYLLVLNAGLLIIAYNKSWRILNISAFGLTVLVLAGIIYTLPKEAYGISFIYITVLYLLFFAINIANNIKENKKFLASDFTILLINTALYFSAGLYLLTMMNADVYRGLFSASLGALNLLLSFILFKTKRAEINILYLLIGITLTFLSLTAPIQLHGHFITLFWAAETVLLYWLYQKSGIKLMRTASLIIWVAMLFSLLLDWYTIYGSSNLQLTIVANKGFITTVCVAISCFLRYVLSIRPSENKPLMRADVFKYVGVLLLFLAGALEINHQFLNHYPLTDLNVLYLMLYLPVFVYVFGVMSPKILSEDLNWAFVGWIYAVTIMVYILVTPEYFNLQSDILTGSNIGASHFWAHWIGDIFVLVIFYRLIINCKDNLQGYLKPVSWVIAVGVVLFLSFEVCLLSNFVFFTSKDTIDHLETLYIKTGLPVLWGIASFALMWLGMHYKTRVLRIISLTLFTLTLIKLFVFDIENIPPAGKIAAFFCLGVLLLIISFMYQKVKVIIADDGDVSKSKWFYILFVWILMCPLVRAQITNFKYKAEVQKIDSSGVYRIELSPNLIAKSYDGSSDIRITDNKGKAIAYVLSSKLSLSTPDSFIVFPEVAPEPVADTAIFYTAENKNALNISQLWLTLKKTGVSRTVNLSGSDDLKSWFAISEDVQLEQAGEGQGTDYQQSLAFPTSNYHYFRVQVISKNKTPIKILQAGIYTTSLNKPVFSELPPVDIRAIDTNKTSRVFINLHEPYQVNKLHFNISGPKYFSRRVVVYAMNKNGGGIERADILADTVLTSTGSQDIPLSAKTKKLRVDVYNGDDNPLTIASVVAYQLKLYAVCYLESRHTYSVYTGNSGAKSGEYDLSFLNNRAYNQLPGISHGPLRNNNAYAILPIPKQSDHSILLWTSLILVLLILSFLTLKMVREIK